MAHGSPAKQINFIYYFAQSPDGFIADAHGSVDWLR